MYSRRVCNRHTTSNISLSCEPPEDCHQSRQCHLPAAHCYTFAKPERSCGRSQKLRACELSSRALDPTSSVSFPPAPSTSTYTETARRSLARSSITGKKLHGFICALQLQLVL